MFYKELDDMPRVLERRDVLPRRTDSSSMRVLRVSNSRILSRFVFERCVLLKGMCCSDWGLPDGYHGRLKLGLEG